MLSVNQALLLVLVWVVLGLYLGVCVKLLNKGCFRVLDSIILYFLMLIGPFIIIKNFFREKEEIVNFLVNKNCKNKSHGRKLKTKLMKSKRFTLYYITINMTTYLSEVSNILDDTIEYVKEKNIQRKIESNKPRTEYVEENKLSFIHEIIKLSNNLKLDNKKVWC